MRQLRSTVDEMIVGPKIRLLKPLLPKALQHLADAQKIAARLPDSLAAPEEHDASVRDMDAHALAAHRYTLVGGNRSSCPICVIRRPLHVRLR